MSHLGLFDTIAPALDITATGAGTAVLTGAGVPLAGFNGVCWTIPIGAITSGTVITAVAQVSDTSNFAASTAVGTASCGTAGANNVLHLDIWRPNAAYARCVVTPGGTAIIGGAFVQRYSRTGVLPPPSGTAGGTAAGYTKVQVS